MVPVEVILVVQMDSNISQSLLIITDTEQNNTSVNLSLSLSLALECCFHPKWSTWWSSVPTTSTSTPATTSSSTSWKLQSTSGILSPSHRHQSRKVREWENVHLFLCCFVCGSRRDIVTISVIIIFYHHYFSHDLTFLSHTQTDVLWLHIRAVGQWTNRLHGYFEQEQLKCERQRCEVRLHSSDGAGTMWVCYFSIYSFERNNRWIGKYVFHQF